MEPDKVLALTTKGFETLKVAAKYKQAALTNLKLWLTKPGFQDYVLQIEYLVAQKKWDLLLDSFYQIIPFGTGGRRGLVGIGPNRINSWTIKASAQGHSQYLVKKFGTEAQKRGVVIAYDVRKYTRTDIYDDTRPNPVKDLDCKTLAQEAAEVYAANGVTVYIFPNLASTPELSFMVRHLHAVAGDMISASHNPPDWNGKKVVDETGGQLIPPYDQELVDVVVNEVKAIKNIDFAQALAQKLAKYVSAADHEAYIEAVKQISKGPYRNIKILFSPFHGTSFTSTYRVLKELNFDVTMDPVSGKPDPKFSSIMFNIPNPEVEESFINLLPYAKEIKADIIIATDPDGDRIGVISKEKKGWRFFNGNEIMILVAGYLLEELKRTGKLKPSNIIMKTLVTTNFLKALAENYGIKVIGDLLVGIKYIADEMNKLEKQKRINDFILGGEESNGSTSGNYIRDKDSCVPAILISELAAREKDQGHTLGDYLDELYKQFGYYRNYLTEIRLPGAEGMSKIAQIQEYLRDKKPKKIGQYTITKTDDRWQGKPFVSESDQTSRNVIIFYIQPDKETRSIMVTIRPSGTEPKTKLYFEIGRFPIKNGDIVAEKIKVEKLKNDLEKEFIKYCYKILGIDFPDRGFLLFWQLPATDKMHYFEIEPQIAALKQVQNKNERQEQLAKMLAFLGSDPIEKVDKAFKAEYKQGIRVYLNL